MRRQKMSLLSIFIICFSLVLIANTQTAQEEMSAAQVFKDGEINNIIDQLPDKLLSISYPESGVKVDSGNELTPTQVKTMPKIVWESETPDTYYTLLMTDPDAPNRAEPNFREVRHWLLVNIKGNDLSTGTTHFEFIGSGPPKDSGLHRYVFLLFKQTGKLEFDEPIVTNRSRDFRLKSSTRELVAKYDLKLVAGNYYQAQFDDYVPLLHAQLSGN